ncbi:MAG: hypothetical protein HY901_15910 [Deltaproteobacteria bacterium]|nr:hypothetical protein [Deltaproteobacteria bacterium]
MAVNLGSNVLGTVNLPKVNLGSAIENLSQASLDKGIEELSQVVGDSFLKPSTDGKGIFSDINVSGNRLPNPLNALAEKLLGAAGEKLKELGFNPETIAKAFTGTEVGGAAIPSINERMQGVTQAQKAETSKVAAAALKKAETGGAATPTTSTVAEAAAKKAETGGGVASSSSASKATEVGGSSTPVTSAGGDVAEKAVNTMGGTLDSLTSKIDGLIAKGENMTQSDQLKLQQMMQKRSELYQLLSNLISMEHETKKSIIQNIR